MSPMLSLQQKCREDEKIAMLTCYDASFASRLESAGIDAILVGDSLGMVVQGQPTTLPVSLSDMAYHTAAVARATRNTLIIADLPFGSYQASPGQAFDAAARLMASGAHCVKLEGGELMADTVHFLTSRGIPVCGHLGLLPQSVFTSGGYGIQAKTTAAAERLIDDALLLEQAGASMVVLEAIPAALARQTTERIKIPTIGIGAGNECDGQVLVLYDMLGITPGKTPRFVRNFMDGASSIQQAIEHYIAAVKDGSFPAHQHSYLKPVA